MWTINKVFNLKSTKIKLYRENLNTKWYTHISHFYTKSDSEHDKKSESLKLTFVNRFSALVKNDKNAIHILSLHQYPIMCMKNLMNWKKWHFPGSNYSPKSWFYHDWSQTFLKTMVITNNF